MRELLLRDKLETMSYLERGYRIHPWRITGVAQEHVRYLASVSAKVLAARLATGPKWDDKFAWPTSSDPRSIVVGIGEPPNGVREAERILGAVHNFLDYRPVDWEIVIAKATPLFSDSP